ncbi:DNA-binding transcriptional regulator, Lrp family [Tenacibaculum sp. MAR_2010_89]|uniref:Lrp/AsnC family transcriptional regulator n=1 Tax=Tenacibaculum sp. MAR_2010_89 TaxID=1250198 RepID=UPI00089689B4|nr:Lrp/AsnC family transcriptional regulator [Tenacibaculum sp. MAR_2010_89]SED40910.1 DNA-binding transcriptional regulator, Lrp family [Tenacibaculum sp. MAR_2010_89]
MKLDQKDIQILNLLQKNARLSNKEIAAELEIAASTCHERLKRLTRDGFFKSFNANLNLNKLEFNIEVMISIQLNKHEREVINSFIKNVRKINGVIKLYHMAGKTDFMLHVAVCNSNELRSLILDELTKFNYIGHIESSMIYFHDDINQLLIKPQ